MKKSSISLFSKIYLISISVFAVILIIGLIILYQWLLAYERSQPKYYAQEVFNKYFRDLNIQLLDEDIGLNLSKFESPLNVENNLRERYKNDELTFFPVSDDNGIIKYAVAAENKGVFYFTLKKGIKDIGFGMKNYDLLNAELLADSIGAFTVTAPDNYSVTVNGINLSKDYIIENMESESCKHMPNGINGIKFTKYRIEGLLFIPKITAVSEKGNIADTQIFDTSCEAKIDVVNNKTLEEKFKNLAIKAATQYTLYMSNDVAFDELGKYLDDRYKIYHKLKSMEIEWFRPHYSHEISDEKATEFHDYSEDVFSCRVELNQTLKSRIYDDHIEHIDVTLYFHKKGNGYAIYDMAAN